MGQGFHKLFLGALPFLGVHGKKREDHCRHGGSDEPQGKLHKAHGVIERRDRSGGQIGSHESRHQEVPLGDPEPSDGGKDLSKDAPNPVVAPGEGQIQMWPESDPPGWSKGQDQPPLSNSSQENPDGQKKDRGKGKQPAGDERGEDK